MDFRELIHEYFRIAAVRWRDHSIEFGKTGVDYILSDQFNSDKDEQAADSSSDGGRS